MSLKIQTGRLLLSLTLSLSAFAAPITFTYSGTGSGTLGANTFTSQSFIITAQGDTDNITSWPNAGPGPQLTHSSASIFIAGLGTFDFTQATHTWRGTGGAGGFGQNLSSNILTFNEASLASYGLDTSIGPILESAPSAQAVLTSTSGGNFRLDAASSFTFEAVVSATVPEPATFALIPAGLACLLVLRRRT